MGASSGKRASRVCTALKMSAPLSLIVLICLSTFVANANGTATCEECNGGSCQSKACDKDTCATYSYDGNTYSMCDHPGFCNNAQVANNKCEEVTWPDGQTNPPPGSTVKLYCSTTTPTGGMIPAGAGCTVDTNAATVHVPWNAGLEGDASARTKTVTSGDMLHFMWTGSHNVYEMASQTAFESCNFTGATELGSTSPVMKTVSGDGPWYFACQVGSHCQNGQKLQVDRKLAVSTTCSDDDAKLQADTEGTPLETIQTCADLATYCADDSALVTQGAPAGWLASTCPATCGLCGGTGTCAEIKAAYKDSSCCYQTNNAAFTNHSQCVTYKSTYKSQDCCRRRRARRGEF